MSSSSKSNSSGSCSSSTSGKADWERSGWVIVMWLGVEGEPRASELDMTSRWSVRLWMWEMRQRQRIDDM